MNDSDTRAAKSIVELHLQVGEQEFLAVDQPGGDRNPVGRGASQVAGGLSQRRGRACIYQGGGRDGTARPDRGADRQLLHL